MSRHSLEDRHDHLMSCAACWLAWAKISLAVGQQIEERRYYAAAGLPFPTRATSRKVFRVREGWPE